MKLTKTEMAILELFTSKLTSSFTIREISRLIKKDLKIVHTSVKNLLRNNFLLKDGHNCLQLNYQDNIQDLAYVENLRKEKFLEENLSLNLKIKEFLKRFDQSFFVFLLLESRKNFQFLVILPREAQEWYFEEEFTSFFPKSFAFSFLTHHDFQEQLGKREDNLANQALKNHYVLFGGESYYRLLNKRSID